MTHGYSSTPYHGHASRSLYDNYSTDYNSGMSHGYGRGAPSAHGRDNSYSNYSGYSGGSYSGNMDQGYDSRDRGNSRYSGYEFSGYDGAPRPTSSGQLSYRGGNIGDSYPSHYPPIGQTGRGPRGPSNSTQSGGRFSHSTAVSNQRYGTDPYRGRAAPQSRFSHSDNLHSRASGNPPGYSHLTGSHLDSRMNVSSYSTSDFQSRAQFRGDERPSRLENSSSVSLSTFSARGHPPVTGSGDMRVDNNASRSAMASKEPHRPGGQRQPQRDPRLRK